MHFAEASERCGGRATAAAARAGPRGRRRRGGALPRASASQRESKAAHPSRSAAAALCVRASRPGRRGVRGCAGAPGAGAPRAGVRALPRLKRARPHARRHGQGRPRRLVAQADTREAEVRSIFKNMTSTSRTPSRRTNSWRCWTLGLLDGIEDRVSFVIKAFDFADENHDGVISFEEFKTFYKCAKDAAAGKPVDGWSTSQNTTTKKKGGIKGKDVKALSPEIEQARKAAERERLRKKSEQANKIAQENRELGDRLKANMKGRDSKALSAEIDNARREAALRRKEAKADRERMIREENKRMRERVKKTTAKDEKGLSAETLSARKEARGGHLSSTRRMQPRSQRAKAGPCCPGSPAPAERREGLSAQTLSARKVARRRSFELNEAHAATLAEGSRVMLSRIASASGRDEKGLSAATLAARKRLAKESADAKAAYEEALRAENRQMAYVLANTGAGTRRAFPRRPWRRVERSLRNPSGGRRPRGGAQGKYGHTSSSRRWKARMSRVSARKRSRHAEDRPGERRANAAYEEKLAAENFILANKLDGATVGAEKGLSARSHAMRKQVAAESAAAKAAYEDALAAENKQMHDILSNVEGKDEKGLSAEVLAARKEIAEYSAAAKAAHQMALRDENAAMAELLANTEGRDEKGLSAETLAARRRSLRRRRLPSSGRSCTRRREQG